ncbi:hypothetical protein KM043_000625 [Ampulex compressa]|nr:hypothetical protein KM043_000625 [Ampulex compressa]
MLKKQLEAYRRQKYRIRSESMKNSMKSALPWKGNTTDGQPLIETSNDTEEDEDDECHCTLLTKVTYLLYFILWATLYVIALEFEFGAVYFILSMFLFIWFNTRSGPRKMGEPSAYSVFNPNCEAIEGTLDASQFENEIRYGIGSVR